MEINKQLFEDVLSGKLKGVFVLRSGTAFNGKCLKRTETTFLYYNQIYPYALVSNRNNDASFASSYTENGTRYRFGISSNDIIDFIPDTNMKQNELTIEIPEGKEIDWDESKKQNKIVLKDKQLTYRDICDVLFKGGHYYINGISDIEHSYTNPYLANTALTKHQLECILAKNKLATVAVYLNDGWKPEQEDNVYGLTLDGENKDILFPTYLWNTKDYTAPRFVFKTKELAQQAIEILGEETVKLALEPLGI